MRFSRDLVLNAIMREQAAQAKIGGFSPAKKLYHYGDLSKREKELMAFAKYQALEKMFQQVQSREI